MPQYDDTNRGVLFRERNKKSDKSPDYTGKIDVNGKPYRLAAWIKESPKAGKFMSISVSEFEDKQEAPRGGGVPDDPLDSDIPF